MSYEMNGAAKIVNNEGNGSGNANNCKAGVAFQPSINGVLNIMIISNASFNNSDNDGTTTFTNGNTFNDSSVSKNLLSDSNYFF